MPNLRPEDRPLCDMTAQQEAELIRRVGHGRHDWTSQSQQLAQELEAQRIKRRRLERTLATYRRAVVLSRDAWMPFGGVNTWERLDNEQLDRAILHYAVTERQRRQA